MDETQGFQSPPIAPTPTVFNGPISQPDQAVLLEFLRKNTTSAAVATGSVNITGSSTDVPVAHGLGVIPNFISWSPYSFWDSTNGLSTNFLSSTPADATHFYVSSQGALTRSAVWFAAKL